MDFAYDLYSSWDVQQFLGRVPRVMGSRASAEALIQRLSAVDDPVKGYWVVENASSADLLGTVMLQGIRRSGETRPSDELEIGWHFHPRSWGHGYATRAAKIVLHHAFSAGADQVIAVVHPENLASRAVCTRLGMASQGLSEKYYDATYELYAADRQRSG